MLMLSLLRHAKSDWPGDIASDHDRPLATRGVRAAPRMGRYIRASGNIPDTVLCSTALRARQTMDLVLPELSEPPMVKHMEELYHAGPEAMFALLRKLTPASRYAMIVGHNPGLQAFALDLCEDRNSPEYKAIAVKFPTAALALYQFNGNWPDLRKKSSRLLAYVTPRGLAGS